MATSMMITTLLAPRIRLPKWLPTAGKLTANTALFASLLTVGDVIAQKLEKHLEKKKQLEAAGKKKFHVPKSDLVSAANSQKSIIAPVIDNDTQVSPSSAVFKSGILIGSLNYLWYVVLDGRLPGHGLATVAKKVLLDQLVASHLTNAGFMMTCGMFEGKTPKQCANEMKSKYLMLYLSDWLFWVPAQFINFRYVPAKYRVAFVSGAQVVWNVFLCYHKNAKDVLVVHTPTPHGHHHQKALTHPNHSHHGAPANIPIAAAVAI